MIRSALIAIVALALGGCAVQRLPQYDTSRDTLTFLHRSHYPTIALGPFEGREINSLWFDDCSVIGGRDKKKAPELKPVAYAAYIRNALAREMAVAGKYSETNPAVTISATIDRFTVSRKLPFRAYWNIGMTFTSSNGVTARKSVSYEFDGDGIYGPASCRNAAAAFGPAVGQLVSTVIRSPEFAAMVRTPAKPS